MFDIGFGELVLLALIALIVLGPERLPRVARAAGHWTGRARAYARNFTAELERQANVDEMRQQIHPEVDRLKAELKQAEDELKGAARDASQDLKRDD